MPRENGFRALSAVRNGHGIVDILLDMTYSEEKAQIIKRCDFHGEWNDSVSPEKHW